MEKRNQIYLVAFFMYLVAGLAGYINQISNYWVVLVLSLLLTTFAIVTILTDAKESFKSTMFDWISLCSFAAIEVALTICVEIAHVPYSGFFRYFNYTIQILGCLFAVYAIVRYVLSYTHAYSLVKEKWSNRKNKNSKETIANTEIASKVEETITQETASQDTDVSDVEVVGGETSANSEVMKIEHKEEDTQTPYMEEEL